MPLTDHLIRTDRAIKMIANYRGNQYAQLQSGSRDPDFHETKAVWIPIPELEEYIKHLKTLGNVDGVRIYFSAYGSDNRESRFEYTNRQSIVLVPTVEGDLTNDSSYHQHRDVYNSRNEGLQTINLENPENISEGDQLSMFNEVQSWPPPPPFN